MKRGSFKDLNVRKKGMQLSLLIYQVTKTFPKEEVFGLISQMRRSAFSIPSNIAEGNAKSSNKHFQVFIENAQGSLFELETQYLLSKQLLYIEGNDEIEQLIENIGKMLHGFHTSLQ